MERMDKFWAEEIGCRTADLYGTGVTLCAPKHRHDPRWMGWITPFIYLRLDTVADNAGVISAPPELLPELTALFPANDTGVVSSRGGVDDTFIRQHFPFSTVRTDNILYCEESSFIPAPEIYPVTQLHEGDSQAHWYRLHFDGPIFVARNERQRIIAWAAIKCKSDDIWEMAVVTDATYRNHGMARSVVSRATRYTLDAGRVPMYMHDPANIPSSRVCRALGYQPYGYQLSCESGRKVTG
jgi:GNAT superfamily N-acetyltransferase